MDKLWMFETATLSQMLNDVLHIHHARTSSHALRNETLPMINAIRAELKLRAPQHLVLAAHAAGVV